MKDEISREEMDEIEQMLKAYIIPVPEKKRIDMAVNHVAECMRHSNSYKADSGIFSRLIKVSAHVLRYSGKRYFLVCLVIYAAVLLLLRDNRINPYTPVIILGPVPFMAALLDIFRSREAGMAELEASFKYNLKQLMISKLVLAAFTNIVCNSVFSIAILGMYKSVNPAKVFLFWCVPFLFISTVSLFITMRIRGYYAPTVCLGIWSAFSVYITGNTRVMEYLVYRAEIELFVLGGVISSIFLIYAVSCLLIKSMERGDLYGTDSAKYYEAI